MSDYFDRSEQKMCGAIRRGAHEPWWLRLRPRLSRPMIVALAGLLVTGTALAASGVFRTGIPVGDEVTPTPTTNEGSVIAQSSRVLPLRVADPRGGPPWGLRALKTTRGLMCVEPGRVLDGKVGVLGEDGAFSDDKAFHPLSRAYLAGQGCGTQDARGDAFLNEQIHGLPANGFLDEERHPSGGCYTRKSSVKSCPDTDRRDVYYGLLGPDATSVTYATPSGALATEATAGSDGAYLIVLPHTREHCGPFEAGCVRSENYTSIVGPELEPNPSIRTVTYRNKPPCTLPLLELEEHGRRCSAVGYVPPSGIRRGSPAQVASTIAVHVERARHYCDREADIRPCDGRVPAGYRRLHSRGAPPQLLIVIGFTARVAVPNFDSHYEINTTNLDKSRNPKCPGKGSGTFGPTDVNLYAGQHIRYPLLVNPRCHGRIRITVGLVTVNGPSGEMPVPGLPGQSGELHVGSTDFTVR